MIKNISFIKTYSVEPWINSDNPRLKIKKIKLKPFDRGYKQGKKYFEYLYIPLFKKGLTIDFKPNANVIVGSNGCGKSQLFKILNNKINGISTDFGSDDDIIVNFEKIESMSVNFESDALKNSINPNPNDMENFLRQTAMVLDSREKSHGENSKILLDFYNNKENNILFMDEPENGLDLKSQVELIHKIKNLAKNNQIFIISHNKMLIEAFDNIYDMDRFIWTKPDELFKNLNL
jgi:predicted ATPase